MKSYCTILLLFAVLLQVLPVERLATQYGKSKAQQENKLVGEVDSDMEKNENDEQQKSLLYTVYNALNITAAVLAVQPLHALTQENLCHWQGRDVLTPPPDFPSC